VLLQGAYNKLNDQSCKRVLHAVCHNRALKKVGVGWVHFPAPKQSWCVGYQGIALTYRQGTSKVTALNVLSSRSLNAHSQSKACLPVMQGDEPIVLSEMAANTATAAPTAQTPGAPAAAGTTAPAQHQHQPRAQPATPAVAPAAAASAEPSGRVSRRVRRPHSWLHR
jgi:hypothetical protein